MSTLTHSQKFILQRVIDGMQQKQIALELGRSKEAVRVELFRARQRVGVESLYQLVALSVALGWCKVETDSRRRSKPVSTVTAK